MTREERRQQLLDAAKRAFAEKGYHATSVSDIIQRASVARGTFYLYFPSKYAIFEALLDNILEEVQGGIRRVDLSPGAPSPEAQLCQNVVWILSLLHSRPALLRILLWEAVGLDEELDAKLASFHLDLFALTSRTLETGIEMGLIRPCNTPVMARCIVGALKEILLSLLVRRDLDLGLEPGSESRPDPRNLSALARELVDSTLGGLWKSPSVR